MSELPASDVDGSSEEEKPEYTEVDEARKAHRRLFTLGLLALILAIIAFFFPRCDFSEDNFGAGSGLTDQQLLDLIKENCVIPEEAGPAGDAGEPGSTGAPGAQGPAGEQGDPGTPGAQGSTGARGPAGATGSQGPAGATGATGACGPIGPTGATGATGPAGAQGLPGPVGPQGIQGVPGPVGPEGPQGSRGPKGDQGDPGLPGSGGLGLYGSFYDTCTQPAAVVDTAYPFRFNNSDFPSSTGVTITGTAGTDGRTFSCVSGSAGSPTITFAGPGIFNIQFSAQYWRTQGGNAADISIWLKKKGVNVDWTNTDFTTEANNEKRVAIINWFVPVTCSGSPLVCDTYEIWWSATKNDMQLLAVPAASNPTRPAIPSLILTVNQVGNLPVTPPG